MNYGRIRRGPMAADSFTQIRNALFRDPRLSFRDKGVFGLISTHRDGYGVTAESIAALSPTDGVTAVKTSLRNLEKHGYLQRTRQRNANGTLGGAVYFITDQPEAFDGTPEVESPRSQPAVAQPPLAEPTQAEPTVAEPAVAQPTVAESAHKKNNSKHIRLEEDSLSPSASADPPQPPATPSTERETTPQHDDPATAIVNAYTSALHRPARRDTRTTLHTQATELLADGFPAWWLIDRARELATHGWSNLAQHCDRSTVPTARTAPDGNPPWCGTCFSTNYRMTKDPTRDNELVECDACHPAAVARHRRAQAGAAA